MSLLWETFGEIPVGTILRHRDGTEYRVQIHGIPIGGYLCTELSNTVTGGYLSVRMSTPVPRTYALVDIETGIKLSSEPEALDLGDATSTDSEGNPIRMQHADGVKLAWDLPAIGSKWRNTAWDPADFVIIDTITGYSGMEAPGGLLRIEYDEVRSDRVSGEIVNTRNEGTRSDIWERWVADGISVSVDLPEVDESDTEIKLSSRGDSTVHGLTPEREEIPHTHLDVNVKDFPSSLVDESRRNPHPGEVVYGGVQQLLPSGLGNLVAGEEGDADVIRNDDGTSGVGIPRTRFPNVDPAPYSDRFVGTSHQRA